MFSLFSKLQRRANGKRAKRWWLFHATDFESLMYPSFMFGNILGILPYKINASVLETSTLRYIHSTIVSCACFIFLLCIFYMMDISGSAKHKNVFRALERRCFYILGGFLVIVTYILSGPRMRLLQTIMEISSKLPSKSYKKLSRLIHVKDILGFFYLVIQILLCIKANAHIVIKIFIIYVCLLIFHMDMLYISCVCILKACFKSINYNLEDMRICMMNDEANHLDRMYCKQRTAFLLIELKTLKKQHLMISNAVQMLNMIFSLHLLATISITFAEITFGLYYHILYWQKGISVIYVDDYIYGMILTTSVAYYFIKIILTTWACETGKNQALRVGTTVHDVFNSIGDDTIKRELQQFSLQILHQDNTFSAKGFTVDASLLAVMVRNISTYLLILMQFSNMTYYCEEYIATNTTQIIH